MFIDKYKPFMLLEADGGAGGAESNPEGVSGDDTTTESNASPETLAAWAESLPEEQREQFNSLFDTETKGLRSALVKERENGKSLEKKLRKLAGEMEDGSAAKKELEELAEREADIRNERDFYAEAHKAGVANLSLAYIAAKQGEFLDTKTGEVDWKGFKAAFPELFQRKANPAGNAGNGTRGRTNKTSSINDWIRKRAGRA